MIDIEQLLTLVPEKHEWRNTTSKKFKRDLFNFFNKPEFKELSYLEIGCAKGHTLFIMSKLFNIVHGINESSINDAFTFCTNNGSSNINLHIQDVYINGLPNIEADVIMIDAVHTYEAVKIDIKNTLSLKSKNKKYLIFDDTGIEPPVLNAVKEYCDNNILKIVTTIGHKPGDFFHRKLYSEEGIICKEV